MGFKLSEQQLKISVLIERLRIRVRHLVEECLVFYNLNGIFFLLTRLIFNTTMLHKIKKSHLQLENSTKNHPQKTKSYLDHRLLKDIIFSESPEGL